MTDPIADRHDPAEADGSLLNTTQSLPIDLLRLRLSQGRGRLLVVAATTCVWVMDQLLARQLSQDEVIAPTLRSELLLVEQSAAVVFVVVTMGLLLALFRGSRRHLLRWGLLYLTFSVIQVIANVLAMVYTAGHHHGGGLFSLWHVAALYMESVLVFMFIYLFIDVSTPGGAFVWPSRQGEPPAVPHIIDYLFLSLNVNSTYGPTSEALLSRPAKLVMSLQVQLSMLMLTVLIARAVSATS